MRRYIFAIMPIVLLRCAFGGESAHKLEWQTDFETATAKARETGRYLLVNFTGSDWCPWCIKLEKEVFSEPAFVDFAQTALVLSVVDFPRKKEQTLKEKTANQALLKKFGVEGLPTILILSPTGEEIGRLGYEPGGAEPFVTRIKALIQHHETNVQKTEAEAPESLTTPQMTPQSEEPPAS